MDKPGTHPETLVRLSPAGAAAMLEAQAVRAKMEEFLRSESTTQLTAALEEALAGANGLIKGRMEKLELRS